MAILFQIILVILLVLLNGYFVASEFALVGIRKTRLELLAKKGNKNARLLKKAKGNLGIYISATQLGITVASLGLGWIGEPAMAQIIRPLFNFLPFSLSWISAHTMATILAFLLITFLHIVLGELTPKTLALQKTEKVALAIITPLRLFAIVFKPFIWILNSSGSLILGLFGMKAPLDHQLVHSEEEIKMLLSQSGEEGVIPKAEVEMVQNVFRLGDTTVGQAMTPRNKILALSATSTLEQALSQIQRIPPHSRFPVCRDSLDKILGFVHIKDIYAQVLLDQGGKKLTKLPLIREILKTKPDELVDDLLLRMREKRVHIAVVRDANKKTVGIITLEDIIEGLVGEIEDEFEED